MKTIIKQALQSVAATMVLPGLLIAPSDAQLKEPVRQQIQQDQQTWIPVIRKDGRIVAMELESYICRVVLGEMPASFDEEALKAQAVAARTYTLQQVELGDRHHGAICTDYTCCQEYLEPEDYIGDRGTQAHVDKVFQAVLDTAGQVLRYDGELISATYFASAGGQTESAEAVWGSHYPYLVPVSSPETSSYDGEQKRFTLEQFQDLLGVCLDGAPEDWFGPVTYTVGDGVETMWIGQHAYRGTTLRSIFGLRSTIFDVWVEEDQIVFQTMGYGHRVGMSQYGADHMADNGYNYRQILAHYYQGTDLEYYKDND